jgi:glucosylglycerate phosphorylase
LTAQAIMLSLQGVPGIYFQSLFGSRGDPAAARSAGLNRRINREKLERAALERALEEPRSLRSLVFSQYATLLQTRRRSRAFAPSSRQKVLNLDPRVFAVFRETEDGSEHSVSLHNVSPTAVTVSPPGAAAAISLEPFSFEFARPERMKYSSL